MIASMVRRPWDLVLEAPTAEMGEACSLVSSVVIDLSVEDWFNCMVREEALGDCAGMIASSGGAIPRIPCVGRRRLGCLVGFDGRLLFHRPENKPMVCVTTWGFSRVGISVPQTLDPI